LGKEKSRDLGAGGVRGRVRGKEALRLVRVWWRLVRGGWRLSRGRWKLLRGGWGMLEEEWRVVKGLWKVEVMGVKES
jgi:hypothetical protein